MRRRGKSWSYVVEAAPDPATGRLGEVRPIMIERLYAELAVHGGRGGRPLSLPPTA